MRAVRVGLLSLSPVVLSPLWLSLSACKDRKPGGPEPGAVTAPAAASCASDSDCPEKWVCLASRCANPSSSAIYTDPSRAVTPDKVEREMEQVGQQHEQDIDRQVEAAESADKAQ
jgi:hypothetical protein